MNMCLAGQGWTDFHSVRFTHQGMARCTGLQLVSELTGIMPAGCWSHGCTGSSMACLHKRGRTRANLQHTICQKHDCVTQQRVPTTPSAHCHNAHPWHASIFYCATAHAMRPFFHSVAAMTWKVFAAEPLHTVCVCQDSGHIVSQPTTECVSAGLNSFTTLQQVTHANAWGVTVTASAMTLIPCRRIKHIWHVLQSTR